MPLEAINAESSREKSIRFGHPATIHLWWSRKPLATARAVLFAQLVDDPSGNPEEFPTEELQRVERTRLHRLMADLVVWENSRDPKILAAARAEVAKSAGGELPSILDPFAGGGSIPLEATRLGLHAVGSDINPVAVLINRALIELPAIGENCSPVFPGLANSQIHDWGGADGLAADVRAYGHSVREALEGSIGNAYPAVAGLPVIAWIWARTVTCPNPGCRATAPLTSTWRIGRKSGNEASISVRFKDGFPSFDVHTGSAASSISAKGTVNRSGAICAACETAIPLAHVRSEGFAGRLGQALMAAVVKSGKKRVYVAPDAQAVAAAQTTRPEVDLGRLPHQAIGFSVQGYGLTRFDELFSDRQMHYLAAATALVSDLRNRVRGDARQVFEQSEADKYADAVATYVALALSRTVDLCNSFATWSSSRDQTRNLFNMQTVQMSWEWVEVNPFARAAGDLGVSVDSVARAIESLPLGSIGEARQENAISALRGNEVLSTDPPYYDYVGYSDLSDVFYGWLRRSLAGVHPDLFGTLLVPKGDELVANSFRHPGKEAAHRFFEDGFTNFFKVAREGLNANYPATVYYAFKQADERKGNGAASAWESIIQSILDSGWTITATWPIRSERAGRMRDVNSNALASSIVLALRPRHISAGMTDRRGFISALELELPDALRHLQQGAIAPVDLPQTAIGPGMAVFSRFSAVLEPDGTRMTVRSALARINEILDQVLNEQEGELDSTSRFALAWYRGHGYGAGKFGDADNLARARNTSVDAMTHARILTSRAGIVQLIRPAGLAPDYDVLKDGSTSNWEALHHLIKLLERDGIASAGHFLGVAVSRRDGSIESDLVKELAHLLFRVAEANGWAKDALAFNTLVTSWPELVEGARDFTESTETQGTLEFDA